MIYIFVIYSKLLVSYLYYAKFNNKRFLFDLIFFLFKRFYKYKKDYEDLDNKI